MSRPTSLYELCCRMGIPTETSYPSDGIVDAEVVKQIMWEREQAIKQLKSYGVELFEETAVVQKVIRAAWIERPPIKKIGKVNIPVVECSACGMDFCDIINNHKAMYNFCPYCGADMRNEVE